MSKRSTEISYEIADRLVEIREQRNWSMEQLASAIGTTLGRLHKYERGTEPVTLPHAMLIAETLDVPLEMVAYGEGMQSDEEYRATRDEESRRRLAIQEKVLKAIRGTE